MSTIVKRVDKDGKVVSEKNLEKQEKPRAKRNSKTKNKQ